MCIFRPALAIRFHSAAFQSVTNAGACRSCRLLRMLAGWAPMGGGQSVAAAAQQAAKQAAAAEKQAAAEKKQHYYSAAAAVKQHNQGWFRCFVFAFDC